MGGETIIGRAAVTDTYERTLQELSSTTTHFRELRVIEADNCAVVTSVGEYHEADGALSVVASCDIVEFAADRVTCITSYTVELSAVAEAGT